MGKHTDALGTIDDFKAPWETESGSDAEIDKPTLRRLIFNLRLDKAKAQDRAEESSEAAKAAEKARDEAKAEAEKASPDEANRKIARLEKQVADLTSERDGLVHEKEHAELRKEVLGDLPEKYAKYVTGEDREALEKSLEAVKEDFGLSEESGQEEDEDGTVRTQPRSRLRNGADPDAGKGADDVVDFDKAAEEILGRGVFG